MDGGAVVLSFGICGMRGDKKINPKAASYSNSGGGSTSSLDMKEIGGWCRAVGGGSAIAAGDHGARGRTGRMRRISGRRWG